mgnify:CR=1 FL=1
MNKLNIQATKVKWVLDEEQRNLCIILKNLGIKFKKNRLAIFSRFNYLSSRYMLDYPFLIPKVPWQKYYFDYYHGGLNEETVFKKNINNILKNQNSIQKIRVSSSLYKNLLVKNGVAPNKIQLIPIAVNTNIYYPIEDTEILKLKKRLNIDEGSIVIGSFQKDGNGWRYDSTPKLIKGPDILIDTVLLLKREIKNLHLIITGKSRSYVIKRLKEIGIKYTFLNADDPKMRSNLYNILDAYLICSREEGGPKGFLEALACNTPVVTTNVGQVFDLGKDRINCFKTNSLNPEEIFNKFMELYNFKEKDLLNKAMQLTAYENSLIASQKHWKIFFKDLII